MNITSITLAMLPPETEYTIITTLIQKLGQQFYTLFQALCAVSFSGNSTITALFAGVGSTLATLFICIEVFTYAANYDFHGGIESAIKFAMKLCVYNTLVSISPNICAMISGLFKGFTVDTSTFSSISNLFNITVNSFDAGIFGINYMVALAPLYLCFIIICILYIVIAVKMVGIIFETALLEAISPVALATLLSSHSRSAGIAFIKNYAAVCMQWGVLVLCFNIFGTVNTTVQLKLQLAGLVSGYTGFMTLIAAYATPILSLVCLCVMVSKVGDLTKRALGG